LRKTKILVFAGALVIAGLFGMSRPAEAVPPISLKLSALAGNFAGEGSATFAVCYNSDFSAVADCSTAAKTAFYNETFVAQGISDKNGNSCSTITITNGPEFPSAPAFPADAFTAVQTVTTTSYDSATESGLGSSTTYNAGSGTSCKGSVLVNTANQAPTGTGTTSFVVSQKGTRIDFVTLTVDSTPINDVTDYVGQAVTFRQ
jgi:hypothetical protein